jgi:hypothetical protein
MRLYYFILAAIASLAVAAPVPGSKPPPLCPTNTEPVPYFPTKIRSIQSGDYGNEGKCKSS